MTRVGVIGAGGRMGGEVCRAVAGDSELELVAAVDPGREGESLDKVAGVESRLLVEGGISALGQAGAEVAVDFTTPSSVFDNIKWCLENSIHAVVGTTGISSSGLEQLAALAGRSASNVLIAPNFAVGAVLMMKFSEMAAKWLPQAEIVELHHAGKLDSPSGTSLKTAEGIARGRPADADSPSPSTGRKETIAGARGAEKEGVPIHSVRLPGLVAHQEVLFGGPGQTLSIRHDSIDRSSFMPGVLLAIREVPNHPGLTVGLEHFLGL